MADAPDLGSGGEILRGSSPLPGTSIAEANALYVEIGGTGRAVLSGECAGPDISETQHRNLKFPSCKLDSQ